MKRHLSGFGISALFHAGLALAALPLWLSQPTEPPAKPAPLTLALAQFQPAPQPVAPTPEIQAVAKPEPKPAPQPIAQPITPPKPVVKTAVAKPKAQLVPKPESKPKPVPKPITPPKPVVKAAVEKPKPHPTPKPEPKSAPQPVTKAVPQPLPVARLPDAASIAKPVVAAVAHPTAVARPTAPKPVPVAPAAPKPPPAVTNPAAEAAYRAKLQRLIASHKQYPRMAEKMEVEGIVTVAFTVLPNGTISGARIAKSSGDSSLDQAALQAVQASSGALPFPPDIRKPQWGFNIGVNFQLE